MPHRPRTSPTPRTRTARLLVLGLVAVLALAGCGRQTDPTSYTDGVKKNFVKGCEAGWSAKPSTADAKTNHDVCQCVIGKITRPGALGGIPFSDFAKAESKLRGDPRKNTIDKVLPKVVTFLGECQDAYVPKVVGPAAPTTTVTATTSAASSTTVKK